MAKLTEDNLFELRFVQGIKKLVTRWWTGAQKDKNHPEKEPQT